MEEEEDESQEPDEEATEDDFDMEEFTKQLEAFTKTEPGPVSIELDFGEKSEFAVSEKAMVSFKRLGFLNLEKLIEEHKDQITIERAPFNAEWTRFQIGGFLDTAISGQIKNGKPAGLCRVIDEYGNFLEGFFDQYF